MPEWFVLAIGTNGFFLFTYKITEKNLDNLLSLIACICGLVIPLFPTARTSDEKSSGVPLNALQHHLGEHTMQIVHVVASAIFIGALGGVSVLFARREGKRDDHDNKRSQRFWRWLHFACAGAMAVAGAWICVTVLFKWWNGPYWSLFAGETACAIAFGTSWFAKGAEINYVLGGKKGARRVTSAESATSLE